MRDYHDREWGVPSHDDRHLFEMLTLEGAQAGLSWATILNRRDGYRTAFAAFDAAQVAAFDDRRLDRLRHDEGIIRNRLKIHSARTNAKAVMRLQTEFDLSAPLSMELGRRNYDRQSPSNPRRPPSHYEVIRSHK